MRIFELFESGLTDLDIVKHDYSPSEFTKQDTKQLDIPGGTFSYADSRRANPHETDVKNYQALDADPKELFYTRLAHLMDENPYMPRVSRIDKYLTDVLFNNQAVSDATRDVFDHFDILVRGNFKFRSDEEQLWNMTRCASAGWDPTVGPDNPKINPMKWTTILKKVLGYDAAVDIGRRVIHPALPINSVFFGMDTITPIKMIAERTIYSKGHWAELISTEW